MLIIPTFATESPNFSFEVELEGRQYTIAMCWNTRSEKWHISVTDPNANSIFGVKAVPDWPLLKNHRSQILMDGDLFILSTKTVPVGLTYNGLGTDYQLVYMSADEVREWEEHINGIR